jgi:hypothetical protein
MEDEFENLRKKSTRSSTIYEEMDTGGQATGLRGFVAGLTPGQRLLLSFLLFVNILAIGVACVVISSMP